MQEIWKSVPGYEGVYEISNFGNLISLHVGKRSPKKPSINRFGYALVLFYKKPAITAIYLHRLVLTVFVSSQPEGMEACHEDRNKSNNCVSNLRWDTHANNMSDRAKHGTSGKGSTNSVSKLEEFQIPEIRSMYASGISQHIVAKKFNVSQQQISRICAKELWTHV